MAAAAEAARQTFYESNDPLEEKYAQSLGPIKLMGELACADVEAIEYQQQKEVVYDDFVFAVGEMMATDPDFRDLLDVDPRKAYVKVNGKVRAPNGEPMVDMVERGIASSKAAAKEDPDMDFQVVRDEGNGINAERADRLPVGWSLLAASMDPKEALREVPKTAEELGYEEGMMYFFRWSHDEENIMDTQSYSVDMSDTSLWREVIRDFLNFEVPEGISADEWGKHGIEVQCSAEEADKLVRDMRTEYYRRLGITEPRLSVTEYTNQHAGTLHQIFDAYFPSLTHAASLGKNNSSMSGLAATILQTPVVHKLEPRARRQLMDIANDRVFDDESGRIMNSILRYVAVEELRKGLPQFIMGKKYNPAKEPGRHENNLSQFSYIQTLPAIVPEMMHERMAANFKSGVEEGRSYGGCAGQIGFEADSLGGIPDPLRVYGSAGNGENYERQTTSESGTINCIKCGQAVNEKQAKEIEGHLRCPHCKYEIEVCTGKEVNPSQIDNRQPAKRIFDLVPVVSLEEKQPAQEDLVGVREGEEKIAA
ncbi:MAG TPA: hypothetical protein VHB72_02880 [Candidatus Saccharimonadales bacterium]|nr:hypothetical protein [Candidatus Saccharimonadales bacterium]